MKMSLSQVVSFRDSSGAAWRSGVASETAVVDGSEVGWPESTRIMLQRAGALERGYASATAALSSSAARPLTDVELGPPVPDASKIICLGLNYVDHAAEGSHQPPKSPVLFAKFATSLVGPYAPIVVPAWADQVDYEGELAVVIGRRVKAASPTEALNAVAGYAVFNDITERGLQAQSSQWTAGKAIDGFAPMSGLTPRDRVPNVQSLDLTTRLNGTVVQSANTGAMIFSVADAVAFISRLMTLEPGDIVATGTPSGVGCFQEPPRFLKPDDCVAVDISGVGGIANTVTPENAQP